MDPVSGSLAAGAVTGVAGLIGGIYAANKQEKLTNRQMAYQAALEKWKADRENALNEASMTSNALKAIQNTWNTGLFGG